MGTGERPSVTFVLPFQMAQDLLAQAVGAAEVAAVVLVSVVDRGIHGVRLLARSIEWVNEADYLSRGPEGMTISSSGYVSALEKAERLGATPIWLHTHPGRGASAKPSKRDYAVDEQIREAFKLRSGSENYGTLIISSGSQEGITFTGRLELAGQEPASIARMWIVGDRLRLIFASGSKQPLVDTQFERNVRALGGGVQAMLGHLHVGVVGCGGTGSAVAEQLARLGVRNFTFIDPKTLSESNVTRVFGSTPKDVGRPKVDVIADNTLRIAPESKVQKCQSTLMIEDTARSLADCDVVFGCTDDNAGRLVLSRLATYFLLPVFDLGVLLTSDESGLLTGINARVTTLVPGEACLVCRSRIDLARASAEALTPGERNRLQAEGYAPALGDIEPAVVTFTALVASTATGELLERIVGYGPSPRPSEVILRCHEREISVNSMKPRRQHYCDASSGKWGRGITSPFLEQTWQR